MYPYDSMGMGFCQDELEEIFVRVGCEVVVGKSSLSIPWCKPFREASESENHFQQLIGTMLLYFLAVERG